MESISRTEAARLAVESEAETQRVKTEAELNALRERELAAKAHSTHRALLRLQELETTRELARTATARLYIGFDKHPAINSDDENS